jgi:hypothetical protein
VIHEEEDVPMMTLSEHREALTKRYQELTGAKATLKEQLDQISSQLEQALGALRLVQHLESEQQPQQQVDGLDLAR